jgi:hypothetical protein
LVFAVIRNYSNGTFAFLGTGLIATGAGVQWVDTHLGFPDSTSFFATSINLLTQNPIATIATTFLGTMNDERYVLGLPFLFLWYLKLDQAEFRLAEASRFVLLALVGLVAVVVARHALTAGWVGPGIERPKVYSDINAAAWAIRPIGGDWLGWWLSTVVAYRFAWLVPLLTIVVAALERRFTFAILFVLSIIATTMASLPVGDVERSVAYSFPALILSYRHLYNSLLIGPRLTTGIVSICLILCLLSPGFILVGADRQTMLINYPLPLVLLRTFFFFR